MALGGRPAQAMARRLLLPVSMDTLLRTVRRRAQAPSAPPRVIGVDEWAWRKGHRYGTLICDLERRAVLDLLPNREPETVAAWLAAHPSVEIITRDRGGGYGAAAAQGRPDAVQAAKPSRIGRSAADQAKQGRRPPPTAGISWRTRAPPS